MKQRENAKRKRSSETQDEFSQDGYSSTNNKKQALPKGWSAFMKAIADGDYKNLVKLYQSGSRIRDVNEPYNEHKKFDINKTNLVKIYDMSIDSVSKLFLSAFTWSCMKGDIALAKLLYNQGADNESKETSSNFTPLMLAYINNNTQIADWLVDIGADLSIKTPKGTSILSFAAVHNNLDQFKQFIEKYMEKLCIDEIDEIDNNDLSQALFYAAQLNNDANVIEFLLQNKANPNYQNNNCDKQTPLMTASHNNKIKNVEVLLQYNDDINQSDINNDTALSLAVAIKDESIVKLLLKSGANPNIQDVDGITPLLWIIRDIENENCVYMNIVKSLLEYNANPNIADDEDKTPILSAAFVAQYNIVYDIIALLLNAGANINAIDDEGFNVAEYVCIDKKYNDNCKQILTLLNNQSIAINNKPFTIQIEDFWDCIDTNSRQDFVKALVELRILTDFTLDQDNQKTLSLLHWAMKLHDFDLVNTILAHGGDFYACDDDGVSSLEIAINMLLKSKQLQIKEQDIVDILTTSSLTLGNYSTYDLNNIEGINTFIKVLIASRYLKIEGEHGSRLLDFYIIKQDVEMVKFLLEKGVQPSKNYTRIIFLDKTKESEEIQKLLHKNHIQNLSITVQEDNLEQYLGLDITDESNQEFLVIGNTNNIVDDF